MRASCTVFCRVSPILSCRAIHSAFLSSYYSNPSSFTTPFWWKNNEAVKVDEVSVSAEKRISVAIPAGKQMSKCSATNACVRLCGSQDGGFVTARRSEYSGGSSISIFCSPGRCTPRECKIHSLSDPKRGLYGIIYCSTVLLTGRKGI